MTDKKSPRKLFLDALVDAALGTAFAILFAYPLLCFVFWSFTPLDWGWSRLFAAMIFLFCLSNKMPDAVKKMKDNKKDAE